MSRSFDPNEFFDNPDADYNPTEPGQQNVNAPDDDSDDGLNARERAGVGGDPSLDPSPEPAQPSGPAIDGDTTDEEQGPVGQSPSDAVDDPQDVDVVEDAGGNVTDTTRQDAPDRDVPAGDSPESEPEGMTPQEYEEKYNPPEDPEPTSTTDIIDSGGASDVFGLPDSIGGFDPNAGTRAQLQDPEPAQPSGPAQDNDTTDQEQGPTNQETQTMPEAQPSGPGVDPGRASEEETSFTDTSINDQGDVKTVEEAVKYLDSLGSDGSPGQTGQSGPQGPAQDNDTTDQEQGPVNQSPSPAVDDQADLQALTDALQQNGSPAPDLSNLREQVAAQSSALSQLAQRLGSIGSGSSGIPTATIVAIVVGVLALVGSGVAVAEGS